MAKVFFAFDIGLTIMTGLWVERGSNHKV